MTAPTLSIVLGTLNRLNWLRKAILSIPSATGGLSYEVIVVDGGSADGTLDYLLAQANVAPWLRVVAQGRRLGAVKAFNAGFAEAQGEYVAAFNDDAEYVGAPLLRAVAVLESENRVGQIALPFYEGDNYYHPTTRKMRLDAFGEVSYANFSVMRRALGDELGWWGDYYHYAGDCELSAKVWAKGLRVVSFEPSYGCVWHHLVEDETRVHNNDMRAFDLKWRPSRLRKEEAWRA